MMSRVFYLLVLVFCFVATATPAAADDSAGAGAKTETVAVGDLSLAVPATWTKRPPSNRLRLAEFDVPAADGEAGATQVVISFFGGGGGGVKANVNRWIGQFDAAGREVALVEGTSPQGDYTYLSVTGTFNKPVGPPIMRRTEPLPGARSVAVILAVEGRGNYFLKLAGPADTVDLHADALLASFGADRESETEVAAE